MVNRFSPRAHGLLAMGALVALLAAAAPSRAGEQLTLAELASRTEGAVVVRVQLGAGKAAPSVELVRALVGETAGTQPDGSWLGLCLPTRKLLAQWARQQPKWPARKLWQQAQKRGSYQAVVFLKSRDGRRYPYCEVEGMFMKHTDLDPGYAGYQQAVEAAWRARPVSRNPPPPG